MKSSANPVLMPRLIDGPMPNGDAADPPVDQIALDVARDVAAGFLRVEPHHQVTFVQIQVAKAINRALDRCQELGGRRRV